MSGWPDGKYTRFTSLEDIKADAITNGLNTTENKLSWWMASDESEFLYVASGLIGTFSGKTAVSRFVVLDAEFLKSKGLYYESDPDEGITVFKNDKYKHFEIIDVNYGKLGIIAEIIAQCTDNDENIKIINWNDAIDIIQKRIDGGEDIEYEKIGNIVRNKLHYKQ